MKTFQEWLYETDQELYEGVFDFLKGTPTPENIATDIAKTLIGMKAISPMGNDMESVRQAVQLASPDKMIQVLQDRDFSYLLQNRNLLDQVGRVLGMDLGAIVDTANVGHERPAWMGNRGGPGGVGVKTNTFTGSRTFD